MAATQALAEASRGEVVFEGHPWNSNTVDLIRLARAHCLLVLHSTFADSVAQLAAQVPSPLCCSDQSSACPSIDIHAVGTRVVWGLIWARR